MRAALVALAIVIAGCGRDAPPPSELVIYVPASLEQTVAETLRAAGIEATLVAGDSAELTTRVIEKRDAPRADILVTDNAIDIWRAGDRGALRPLDEGTLRDTAPALVDPDETWAALRFKPLLIRVYPGNPAGAAVTYTDLGEPDWAGKLCLTSSARPANRALIALMIDDLGVKPAERLVRRWVRNLSTAPFADPDALEEAAAAGACPAVVGPPAGWDTASRSVIPEPLYFDIDGIGVARHARNPDRAQAAVAVLRQHLSSTDLEMLSRAQGVNASVIGWRDEEARLLAERAGYR